MDESWPFFLSGVATTSQHRFDVRCPSSDELLATVAVPEARHIDQALDDLVAAVPACQDLSAAQRAAALDTVSHRISERGEEFAELITRESGKPLMWSRVEVKRAASTFRWAAEEARRWSGTLQRLDTDAVSTGKLGIVRRFPRGVVLGIAPFNFPLNLVAHKVAPAIAVGAPILVKPAPATPLSALLLAELIAETDLPRGSVSVMPVANSQMPDLVKDPRIAVVSFTGSARVGYEILHAVPAKHVTLELGGNAAVVVDSSWPDLAGAAERIALFACYQAGQSCIAVQRVLVSAAVYDEFVTELKGAIERLVCGDPRSPDVQVGPVINHESAARIEEWILEATSAGATVITGGTRQGTQVAPTLLTHVAGHTRLAREEVFGPVVTVDSFDRIDDAFTAVNSSDYGLQAGVFTKDIQLAFRAHRELVVGGVVIGDVPTFRADQMPYGGWKNSGVGREGVRSTMEDLTDERVLILSDVSL